MNSPDTCACSPQILRPTDDLSSPRVPSWPLEHNRASAATIRGHLNHRPSFPRTVSRLLKDLLTIVRRGLTSQAHFAAENLFLRLQLTLYQERRIKPRRPDPGTRVTLVLLSRWSDWPRATALPAATSEDLSASPHCELRVDSFGVMLRTLRGRLGHANRPATG